MAVHIVFWKTTTYHPINVGCGVRNRYKKFLKWEIRLNIKFILFYREIRFDN